MKFFASFLFVLIVLVCNVYCQRGPQKPTNCNPTVDTYSRSYDDCTMYYMCVRGKWLAKRCPNSLFWNQNKKKCDEPELAACVQA